MKNRLFTCLVVLLLLFDLRAQHFTTDDVQLIEVLNEAFEENHVDYGSLFPTISSRFSQSLINRMDPDAEFLLDSDTAEIHRLTKTFSLNPKITRANLESLRELFSSRLSSLQRLLEGIDQLDFFESDSILLDLKQKNYAYDERSLKQQWVRELKQTVLEKYAKDSVLQEKANAQINDYLNEKLKVVLEDEVCRITLKLQEKEVTDFILHAYLRAYAMSFDPHSDFLSAKEENEFINSLSSELYSTGINFSRSANGCTITSIASFSSASDHPDIRKGDKIVRVKVDDEMISPLCISPEVLSEMFFGFASDAVTVELRSSVDRKFRVFELEKHPVRNTTNHIYSYLIEDEEVSVAHILLPSFYSPFFEGDNSSSQDLAIALLEAKRRAVDGIIIDLRDNGGGSVQEAMELLGFFIDYGPLFTIQDKENPSGKLQKDTKKGMLVNAKVIFLVNSLSASASEMVVATMKKYPGSLVVGAQTFGKATGQTMLPIKTTYAKSYQGSALVTSIKVFGFDGSNYQGVGVTPDIILPTVYDKDMASETDYDYVLRHGLIRNFRPIKVRREPIDSLVSLASSRSTLSSMDSISQIVSRIIQNPAYYPLKYDDYRNSLSILEEASMEKVEGFEVQSLETNEAFMNRSMNIGKRSENDRILLESFNIMKDWVQLTKTDR